MHQQYSFRVLYSLHILNDGFYASLLLFLPFLAKDLHINLTQAGLLGTILNSIGMLCALPGGYLAARFGGMKILILSAVLYGLGYIWTGMALSYVWLFPGIAIAGVGFAFFHPIGFALITRLSAAEIRGKNMGDFTAIGDIGKMGISAVLTFIVVYLGWRSTAILYGIVAVICGLFFLFLQRQTDEVAQRPPQQHVKICLREILSHPPFFLAIATSFLDVFSSASLFVFLPFLLLSRGIDIAFLGTFSAVFFLGSLFGKSILGRFSDRFNNASVVMISELCMAICIVLLAHSTSIIVIVFSSIIVGIFTKGTVPVIQTMVSDASEHHGHFEKTFAVNGLIGSIALTISPVFLGFVSDQWGIEAAFYAMAIIAALAILPAFIFRLLRPTVLKSDATTTATEKNLRSFTNTSS